MQLMPYILRKRRICLCCAAKKKETNSEEAAKEEFEAERRQPYLIMKICLSTGMWVLQVTVNDSLGYDIIAREQVYVKRRSIVLLLAHERKS